MGSVLRTHTTILPLTVAERLDAVCDRFEAACEGGLRPRIGDYLEGVDEPARAVLARELILLDLHYRHRRAEVLEVVDYDAVNPDRESGWLARAVAALTQGSTPPVLPGYKILGELGRGGMGVVYKAVEESLGRHVALKVLSHRQPAGPIQLIRFQREARVAALLHHTNIVPVFAVGVHEDVHYYAMQYIDGQGLDSVLREIIHLRRGPGAVKTIPQVRPDNISRSISSLLGPKEAHYFRGIARLGVQAAEALAYAHSHGVLHRDIKPANLLLDLRGTIWVTDFGLAKAEGSEVLTSPGDVVGTVRYLAPERFQGKADPRCDVYSLGVTLYEMLTLEPAFTVSDRVELINKILRVEPARPRKLDPRIPRDLETIVLKAIAKDPSNRFSNADEMASELGRFVEGRQIRSRRVSVPERLWRWSRRNPAVASLMLLAATLSTILAIGSTAAAWRFREQRNAVESQRQDAQAKLGESLMLQARAVRYSQQPGRRSAALHTLTRAAQIARDLGAPPEYLAELRDEVIAALALLDDHKAQTWSGLTLVSGVAACCIDADRYLFLGQNGSIHVHRLSDRAELRVMGSDRPAARSWPRFVAGGRFVLVWSGESQTELWDVERGEEHAAWPTDVRCPAPRADGRQVAALRPDGELRVYDLPAVTEASHCRLEVDVPRRLIYSWMSLSEDGRHLALIHPDRTRASVYEVASGRVVRDVKLPSILVDTSLALSRNGRLLALAHDRVISIYDVADGEQRALLQGHQSEGLTAQFQPGGDLLVSTGWDGTTRLWDPLRGHLLLTLLGRYFEWAGRGSGLVIGGDRDLILHQVAAAGGRRTIDCKMLGDRAGIAISGPWRETFSPDGRLIAIAMRPGVRIVRPSDGVGLACLPIGYCDEALFLPEGSLLTYNDQGLCRWPVKRLTGGALLMGPPQPLAPIAPRAGLITHGLAASASGRLVGAAYGDRRGSVLFDPAHPWRQTWLAPHDGVRDLAISPDGRWAATTGWGESADSRQLKVWDAVSGQLLVDRTVGNADVAFSPDSNWLGIGSASGYRFFRTGAWTPGPVPEIDHSAKRAMPLAFHPGSRIAAILDSNLSMVRLVEVESGHVLASLMSPEQLMLARLLFSPDGRFLAVGRSDQQVDLWDLSEIRSRLEEFDLARGLPDIFGSGTVAGDAPSVDRIEVEGVDPAGLRLLAVRQTLRRAWFAFLVLLEPGLSDPEELSMRAARWQSLGQWRLAVTDYRASLARRPESAGTANDLAWYLSSMPGRGDADEAVLWARRAVTQVPSDTNFRNTLGVALYRAGRFAEAAVELERDIAQGPRLVGYDWVFLAMCRQRLGQPVSARTALAQATRWRAQPIRLTPEQDAEVHTFLHEAQSLLDGSLPDLPAHVFAR
jgi:eukaryotic-like serine/threonine-protein kinase